MRSIIKMMKVFLRWAVTKEAKRIRIIGVFRLYPSSGVLRNIEHKVSETVALSRFLEFRKMDKVQEPQ
jgi:hypothetical protein